MSDFRWELRRKRDGLLVDRAHRLEWLVRASGVVIGATLGTRARASHYFAVHLPTSTVVAERRARGWQVDRDLVRQLEPGEADA